MKSLGITINVRPGARAARAGGAGRAARAFGGQLEEEVAAAAEVAQLMGKWRRFMAQTPYLMGKKPWVLPIVFWCQFSRKRSQLWGLNWNGKPWGLEPVRVMICYAITSQNISEWVFHQWNGWWGWFYFRSMIWLLQALDWNGGTRSTWSFWVNFSDLTAMLLEWCFVGVTIPKWPNGQTAATWKIVGQTFQICELWFTPILAPNRHKSLLNDH